MLLTLLFGQHQDIDGAVVQRPARRLWRRVLWPAAALLLLQACAGGSSYTPPPTRPGQPAPYRVNGQWYQPLPHARDFVQQGVASWYGRDFHGRKTSNGEIYNMHAMTAAHKTLPLGTYVRVRNLGNGKTVDVRINDRGPFVRGRIIDLSHAAASRIGMVGPGTAKVRIEALGAPAPDQRAGQPQRYLPMDYYSGNFTFQVGAFTERDNAARLVNKLDQIYKNAHTTTYWDGSRTYYRVRVGRAKSLEEAMRYEQALVQNGFADTFIVAE
ncbi:MAG: septal ring lytic transglycosylase RlpA family protein [Desulfosarcinaceae bacterium]